MLRSYATFVCDNLIDKIEKLIGSACSSALKSAMLIVSSITLGNLLCAKLIFAFIIL